MVGIAGMLAKRSQKKVGADGGAVASAASTQPTPTIGSDLGNDDLFASFGNRPSTAGSCNFNNIGGYGDDFDDFDGIGGSDTDTDTDAMDDDQNHVLDAAAASNMADTSTETTRMQEKSPGGLSMFRNRSSAPKETPPTDVHSDPPSAPLPTGLPTAAVHENATPSIFLSSSNNFGPSIEDDRSPMDDSFMPPPPRRRPSLSPPKEAASSDEPMMNEDEVPSKKQRTETPLMTETIASSRRYEESTIERDSVQPSITQGSSRPIESNSSPPPQAVLNRNAAPTAGLPAPKTVFQTPKPRVVGSGRVTSVVEPSPPTQAGFRFPNMSSLESPVLPSFSATPPSSNAIRNQQNQNSNLQTPFLTLNVDSYQRAPITPDNHMVAAAAPEGINNNNQREEPFDDLFCAVLEYMQAIKDKNHMSEEEMLEMEVQLDHVIATMNVEMLQMQQMEEEFDVIQRSQEETVSMYRS
jgi:hypothetical protein